MSGKVIVKELELSGADASEGADIYAIRVTDIHVGGDVHRIVLDGLGDIPGETVLEKTRFLERNADGLRRALLDEPRGGHPALFADVLVKPSHPEAQAGLIIMENNGYPMFSGTNIMSAAIALVERKGLPVRDGKNRILLEAPGGLVHVDVEYRQGRVLNVTCQPSKPVFCYDRNLTVDVPSLGTVEFDLFWSGEFFPVIDAARHGFEFLPGEEYDLGAFAKAFLDQAIPRFKPVHPEIDDRRDLASVVFTMPLETASDGRLERRVVPYVYPNRQVGRCAAGMPSSIALAQLYFDGRLDKGDVLRTRSPRGGTLEVRIVEDRKTGPYDGVIVAVEGRGWTIADGDIIVDMSDPMTPRDGFERLIAKAAAGAGWTTAARARVSHGDGEAEVERQY